MGLYTYVVIVKCIHGMHFKMCVNPVYTLFCLFVDVRMYVHAYIRTYLTNCIGVLYNLTHLHM